MSNKIERATKIHRTMTPHQMALRIVELEDIAEIVGQSASERSKRITELQDALALAEEAVRAKQQAPLTVPAGWQLVPVEPTRDMLIAINWPNNPTGYAIMLATAPKLGGE